MFRSENDSRPKCCADAAETESALALASCDLGPSARRLRTKLDQRRPKVSAETIEGRTGRRELTTNSRYQHCQHARTERRDCECQHPRHGHDATARFPTPSRAIRI
jgi:hypothetical protein